jgi:hypothetical protein
MTINPSGICMCGCGTVTGVAKYTDNRSGTRKGDHYRYVRGHSHLKRAVVLKEGQAWDEVDMGYVSPCWVWRRFIRPNGYGSYGSRGDEQLAHRRMYEKHVGPIPEGYHVDHLCCVKACVRPDHLEPVTPLVNAQRYWARMQASA